MKIEKIDDSQIKFILNKKDLESRDINLSDLAYGSKKTQELFQDMMEKAFEEYGFDTNNIPIMIEAIPISQNSIMIIITKVKNPNQLQEKFNSYNTNSIKKPKTSSKASKTTTTNERILFMYHFDNLDDLISVSNKINKLCTYKNTLYKYEQKYYLIVYKKNNSSSDKNILVDNLLCEYGVSYVPNTLFESLLKEHGEILIKSNAIKILSKI